MDIIRLYQDFGVPYKTEGHKHCRPGWVNTPCPFCTGNQGWHLGGLLDGSFFRCWRCGTKFPDEVIGKLLHLTYYQTIEIIKQYGGKSVVKQAQVSPSALPFQHPNNCGNLTLAASRYLTKRGFDPEELKKEWNLKSTGPVSYLDKANYSYRILAPIYWEGQEVSFQARDITGKAPEKYKACSKTRETIHHKDILYRHPEAPNDWGIGVEGITDVWRLGRRAFCTFGIEWTRSQIRVLKRLYSRVFILFDEEPQAQKQAQKLHDELCFRKIDSVVLKIKKGDPGSMTPEEAQVFITNLNKFKHI